MKAAHPGFLTEYEAIRGPRSYTAEEFLAAFWSRVATAESGCWLWTGARCGTDGAYGVTTVRHKSVVAHRVSVWIAMGSMPPPDMQVDHLCRVTLCVRPAHLEVVTPRVNTLRSAGITAQQARQTHCKRGHEFNEVNTRWDKRGRRDCRTCNRERVKQHYWKKKSA